MMDQVIIYIHAGVIKTSFGQTLSWEYLSYVGKHQINWTIPTDILYGERKNR